MAAVWAVAESRLRSGAVQIADVADGTLATAQQQVDASIGLLPESSGERP